MAARKLQIALEFMILFAFVIVVFLFLFALVASQRAQTSSSQIYSQEQLIAQSVAAQLDQALRAGNGYTARAPVTGAIGTLAYQLLITKNGGVIVNATVGNQALQAFAFSTARNILSSSAYLQANTFYYKLPIANGTLSIQNSFGTICIDYACPNISAQASNVSLSSQVVHAALFNGQSTNVMIASSNTLNPATNSFTFSAWVYASSSAGGPFFASKGGYTNLGYDGFINTDNTVHCEFDDGTVDAIAISPSISLNIWNFIACARTTSGITQVYVNGVLQGTSTKSTTSNNINPTQNLFFGRDTFASPAGYLSGGIANEQIYGTALSAAQLRQLYQAGISASPVAPPNIVGWWLLNGDINDYSGNGNNGGVTPIIFPTVAQLFAKVTNPQGYALSNTLVGFESTLGAFVGTNQFATNNTNANGIATAFLTQQGNNGQATVRATAYNGNTVLTANLLGWWPMGLGQGNTIYDLSGDGNSGAMSGGAAWSNPAYAASFDGSTAAVNVGSNSLLSPASFTIAGWIKLNSNAPWTMMDRGAAGSAGSYYIYGNYVSSGSGNGPDCVVDSSGGTGYNTFFGSLNPGTWYFLACTFSSGTARTFVNGVLTATTTGASLGTSTNSVLIGNYTNHNYYTNGQIANLQLYSAALSASQIMQLYLAGVGTTPISTSNLVGWWPLNGDAKDYSGNGLNGTIYGNLRFSPAPINDNASNNATSVVAASFNGFASANVPTMSTPKKITIAFWANYSSVQPASSAQARLSVSEGAVTSAPFAAGLAAPSGASALSVMVPTFYLNGDSATVQAAYNALPGWAFVAGTYDGSTAKLYLNGVPDGSLSYSFSPSGTFNNYLGVDVPGSSRNVNAMLANVQIYNHTLSASQISQLYALGLAGVPLSNSSLMAWWPLGGNANDYSGKGNNGTTANVIYSSQAALLPAVPSLFAGSGADFNGQSSYILLSQQPAWSSSLSVSAWVNTQAPPATGKYREIFNNNQFFMRLGGDSTDHSYDCFIKLTDATVEPRAKSAFQPLQGAWNLVTCTWTGSVLSIYVNGALKATSARSGAINSITEGPYIGASEQLNPPTSNLWNGSISDMQIYNTALNANQVLQLYNSQAPPSASASIPLSWYP